MTFQPIIVTMTASRLLLLLYASAFLTLYSITEAHPIMRRDDEFSADMVPSERHADGNATEYSLAQGRHTKAHKTVDPSER